MEKVYGLYNNLNCEESIFVFDEELMINDDRESINGYLWATDKLVGRLPSSGYMDNINFYVDYKVISGEVSVYATYYEFEASEEHHHQVMLNMSEKEKATIVALMEEYCNNQHSCSCFEFVNEIRTEQGLPALCSPLDMTIAAAHNDDTNYRGSVIYDSVR